jgi:hypothetical protein
MNNRVTPNMIVTLQPGECFVFGSNLSGNLSGIHGGGAARHFGAAYGVGVGPTGRCYALPTKSSPSKSLSLARIGDYVLLFTDYAQRHPETTFLVTEVGCGLAGFSPSQIAPLFAGCRSLPNVHLPERFWAIINGQEV